MSLFIGGDLLLQGEISKGISVLLFSVIIAVCVYVWLIRGWIKPVSYTHLDVYKRQGLST